MSDFERLQNIRKKNQDDMLSDDNKQKAHKDAFFEALRHHSPEVIQLLKDIGYSLGYSDDFFTKLLNPRKQIQIKANKMGWITARYGKDDYGITIIISVEPEHNKSYPVIFIVHTGRYISNNEMYETRNFYNIEDVKEEILSTLETGRTHI